MKRRLVWGSALSILVGLAIAFLLASPLMENLYIEEVRARMELALNIAGDEWAQGAGDEAGAHFVVERLANLLTVKQRSIRITALGLDGTVLADSEAQAGAMQNHADRPEFVKALTEGTGYDIRQSGTVLHQRYYYAARRVGDQILRIALPMEQVDATRIKMMLCVLLGLAGGFAAAMFISDRLSRRVIRPIEEMAEATQAMAEGKFNTRVTPGKDEVGRLGRDFNAMARRLEKAMHALEQNRAQLDAVLQGMDDGVLAVDSKGNILLSNPRAEELLDTPLAPGSKLTGSLALSRIRDWMESVQQDGNPMRMELTMAGAARILSVYVSHLDEERDGRAPGTLIVLSDMTRMRRLEQMRSDFVANVTHELKTPLTSIRGYIELLQYGPRDEATRQSFYDIIDIEAERLYALIEDILQLSEIESSREDSRRQQCNLAEVAQEVKQRLTPQAEKAEVAILVDVPQDANVRGSVPRLQQLMGNLVDNAIKYNRPGGQVEITAKRDRQAWVLRVRDTGIGMDEEHLPRIFERFYRVDKSRSRLMGGTGLGLSICRHIVQLIGGEIHVDSTPGEGTVFTVRLPE